MTHPIHSVRSFPAPPDQVFEAWIAPTTLVAPVIEVHLEPVVGAAVRVSTAADRLEGRVIASDRPHRLAYTWRWNESAEETIIDVRFHPAGDTTVVEVTHRGFHDDPSRATHLAGWVHYLDGLAAFL